MQTKAMLDPGPFAVRVVQLLQLSFKGSAQRRLFGLHELIEQRDLALLRVRETGK